jgi:hypothetical protein
MDARERPIEVSGTASLKYHGTFVPKSDVVGSKVDVAIEEMSVSNWFALLGKCISKFAC